MGCSDSNFTLVDSLRRFIGETVTIFTTSGGLSGRGFTGVLISVNDDFVRLITRIGPSPSCPFGDRDFDRDCCCSRRRGFSNVGSTAEIPINRIASFVHNAI